MAATVLKLDLLKNTGTIKLTLPLSYHKFWVYNCKHWFCTWATSRDRWLESDIGSPSAVFDLDAVDMMFPDLASGGAPEPSAGDLTAAAQPFVLGQESKLVAALVEQ